jgi:hypothetical protein
MRALRFLAMVLLGLLIVNDLIVAGRLLHSGWPKTLVLTTSGQRAQIQVVPIPFGVSDWVLLGLYGALHVALCYWVWKARRSAHRADA